MSERTREVQNRMMRSERQRTLGAITLHAGLATQVSQTPSGDSRAVKVGQEFLAASASATLSQAVGADVMLNPNNLSIRGEIQAEAKESGDRIQAFKLSHEITKPGAQQRFSPQAPGLYYGEGPQQQQKRGKKNESKDQS